MNRKIIFVLFFTILLLGLLGFVFFLWNTFTLFHRKFSLDTTIYIKDDGRVMPRDAPISSVDNVTYTFTDDVFGRIEVEKSNITIDGNGHKLQGTIYTHHFYSTGIHLFGVSNVTIRNMNIEGFDCGVYFNLTCRSLLLGNNITKNNYQGVVLRDSSNNTINENNIATNKWHGIDLIYSSQNKITGNVITDNRRGVWLAMSSYNNISRNDIMYNNECGIWLPLFSNMNVIFENRIINNGYGIRLNYCFKNIIFGNNITANNECGIMLIGSSNNIIHENSITGSKRKIYIDYSSKDNGISLMAQPTWVGSSINPSAITIKQGSTGIIVVTVTSYNNFAGEVSLNCTSLPLGVTATFNPANFTLTAGETASSTLTLTISSTATKDIYLLNLRLWFEQVDVVSGFVSKAILLQVS